MLPSFRGKGKEQKEVRCQTRVCDKLLQKVKNKIDGFFFSLQKLKGQKGRKNKTICLGVFSHSHNLPLTHSFHFVFVTHRLCEGQGLSQVNPRLWPHVTVAQVELLQADVAAKAAADVGHSFRPNLKGRVEVEVQVEGEG
jgi:hypothetical protein